MQNWDYSTFLHTRTCSLESGWAHTWSWIQSRSAYPLLIKWFSWSKQIQASAHQKINPIPPWFDFCEPQKLVKLTELKTFIAYCPLFSTYTDMKTKRQNVKRCRRYHLPWFRQHHPLPKLSWVSHQIVRTTCPADIRNTWKHSQIWYKRQVLKLFLKKTI